jgi:hypothetical protein
LVSFHRKPPGWHGVPLPLKVIWCFDRGFNPTNLSNALARQVEARPFLPSNDRPGT